MRTRAAAAGETQQLRTRAAAARETQQLSKMRTRAAAAADICSPHAIGIRAPRVLVTSSTSSPPPPSRGRVGSFSNPHPNSQWAGLSTTWHAALTDNHAKAAKVFNPREPAQLAKLESNGRRLLQLQQDLRDCVNALSPDNEAVVYMLDFDDELELVLDSIRREIDDYTLWWNHQIVSRLFRHMQYTGF